MKIILISIILQLMCLISICNCASLSIYEQKKFAKQLETQGLYNDTDHVIILTAESLKPRVYNQKYAFYVEFYNAFCGFCRRYAPIWKELAADVLEWRKIVKIGAIDCSVDANYQTCREFEVMAYPTIKYFSPNVLEESKNLGTKTEGQNVDELRNNLIDFLKNETNPPIQWPTLPIKAYTHNNIMTIFNDLPTTINYVFLLYESPNSTLPYELILDLHSINDIIIQYVDDVEVANSLQLRDKPSLTMINRNHEVVHFPMITHSRQHITDAIRNFIDKRKIKNDDLVPSLEAPDASLSVLAASPSSSSSSSSVAPPPSSASASASSTATLKETNINNNDENEQDKEINNAFRLKAKSMNDVVFQADLETALKYTLFHEIPKYENIDGERLTALKDYVAVLNRYSPLGVNGKKFLQDLNDYLRDLNELNAVVYEAKIRELQVKWNNKVFSSNRYVGCHGSVSGLRGFTCGLWLLFHHLTVQAAESEISMDPVEVLQAMHGYVKHFFGCNDCSQHFQSMAIKNRIWNVTSKDNAVLWLWNAHNEVNQRLAGDLTEDPEYPKIQYPSTDFCTVCRKPLNGHHQLDTAIQWDKTEVLLLLKRLHSIQNISRLGVDDESDLPIALELTYVRQPSGRSIFSDVDIRMGILLYIFCLGMLVIAIKLFLRRGYRKKIYAHDLLGKV